MAPLGMLKPVCLMSFVLSFQQQLQYIHEHPACSPVIDHFGQRRYCSTRFVYCIKQYEVIYITTGEIKLTSPS